MNIKIVASVCFGFSITFSRLCLADIEPVSVVDSTLAASASGNGFSSVSEMSSEGRFVAFTSLADNLTTNDGNYYLDVFLRDRQFGTTTLISVNPEGFSGNGPSGSPSLSTNGAWIAFQSEAEDLTASDNNGAKDIFVRNLTLGQTTLVSVNTNGTSGDSASTSPIITPDGRFVAFQSLAMDLVTNYQTSNMRYFNVYLRDLANNATTLVSVGTNGYSGVIGDSFLSGVSADGKYVLFVSSARNLGPNITTGSEIFLRDMQTGQTYWISTNVAKISQQLVSSAAAVCFNPVMSGDGQSLAFRVAKDPWSMVLHHNLASNTTLLISSNRFTVPVYNWDYSGPSISDDGSVVAFMDFKKQTLTSATSTNQIYVWDATNKTNTLVTVAPDGSTPGDASSDSPALSADGRLLAFLSVATNLVANTPTGDHARAYVRDLTSGVTKLVSVETNLDKPAGDIFEYPIINAGGSVIAYSSSSDGLVSNDNNGEEDVFVNNTQTGITELISSKAPTIESATADDNSFIPANGLSSDGRFAVFTTLADNMAARDTNSYYDVFVRDMVTGKSLLVSMNSDGTGTDNGNSTQPSISADGHLVAFQSDGSDLVEGDANNAMDVFIQDLDTRETRLVSARYDGAGSASGVSDSPAITPDGRYVIYRSNAKDLTTNAFSDTTFKAYAYDTTTGINYILWLNNNPIKNPTFLSISPDSRYAAVFGNSGSGSTAFSINEISTHVGEGMSATNGQPMGPAAFSGDGRWVAFVNTLSLVNCSVVLWDQAAKTNLVVGAGKGVWNLSLNGDGSRVVYERIGTSTMPTNKHQVFLYDRLLGSNILVSVNSTGTNGGNGDSRNPIISPDGRFVYFSSQATDLVEDADHNGSTDVFVRDLNSGTTRLLSANRFKTGAGNSQSVLKALSEDGQVVAMESFASDLTPLDVNMAKDVFVLRVQASLEDADNDGLPDSWETKYFGNFERDGTGDFDSDGMSDGAEFLAGTDPTDKQSVLRLTQVGTTVTGRRITWTAIPGKTYLIQFKTNLIDVAWEELAGSVKADATTASKSDDTTNGAEQRFYRVLLMP